MACLWCICMDFIIFIYDSDMFVLIMIEFIECINTDIVFMMLYYISIDVS